MMQEKIAIIIGEFFWSTLIIVSIIKNDIPSDGVFWIATSVEVAIGFLVYYASLRYSLNNDAGWLFFSFLLIIIGFGTPNILAYTIDSLEPIKGTWIAGAFILFSCYLYRIIRKKQIRIQ